MVVISPSERLIAAAYFGVEIPDPVITAIGKDFARENELTTSIPVFISVIAKMVSSETNVFNIDYGDVQNAAAAAITAATLATATDVSSAQSALTTLINALPTTTEVETIVAAAISDADLATASAVAEVKSVVDSIATSVASLDTPPQAF